MTERNTPAAQRHDAQEKTQHGRLWNWAHFALYTLLLLLFLYWIKSWWGLIVVPFLFDAYITRKIPWSWWRRSKNKTLRAAMSWVDAIVFALVAVYFVHNYFGQNYVIPSSSLEKSLLTGDYLLVSKVSYGPRNPMTPLHMPLTSHTLPVLGCKSYLDKPAWKYRRTPGLGRVRQNDIVVFNYPSGDTVALRAQEADYYSICYQIGEQLLPISRRDLAPAEQLAAYRLQYSAGRQYVLDHPEMYGSVTARPVDMRENYVKRCVGLPGQTLEIRSGVVYTDGQADKQPDNVQYNYDVELTAPLPDYLCRDLQISVEDRSEPVGGSPYTLRMPLTQKVYTALRQRPDLVLDIQPAPPTRGTALYPHNKETGWTANDYGPVWIPKKGASLRLTLDNLPIYERAIRVYEGNDLQVQDSTILINGRPADSYTFRMDYYWMMGDNRDNSADSRFWGFVPEDHIVGKPILIWLSLDKDYTWFNGKVRWERLFRLVDNIK
ncbi:MAG: S26 family signal peptidase [Bacteroidaceae bacterium]|nr:S26 family signal peptidase [Bacteroidaceae bacterium]